jgi:2-oxoglutarate ferredoxin oxidoreductase subunit beta
MEENMPNKFDFDKKIDFSWCPGCGNFSIRKELLTVLEEMNIDKDKLVLVSGIGQAAKMPEFVNASFFHGLHGRGLPPATAIKASNPDLTVLAFGGDGDMYGEGGNHLLHTSRKNPDITLFVHDNMIYGLTKGQASPTSSLGMKTPLQVFGVADQPLNPLALAISLDVSFVARAFSGHFKQTQEIMKQAIEHRGFALVDIFQPCVSFNKINTYKWFDENTYYLPEDFDNSNRVKSFEKALESDPYPLGVIYKSEHRKTFEENLQVYKNNKLPLYKNEINMKKVEEEILTKR